MFLREIFFRKYSILLLWRTRFYDIFLITFHFPMATWSNLFIHIFVSCQKIWIFKPFTLTHLEKSIVLQKSDMVKHKLRVTSYELRATSYELRVESLKAGVEIQKCEFKSTSYEFESTSYDFESPSYEFKSTSYEFEFTSYEFESTSYKLESTSYEFKSTSYQFEYTSYEFETTRSVNLRFHYSMATTEWVNITFERRDLNSPEKSHPPWFWINLVFLLVNVTYFSFIS